MINNSFLLRGLLVSTCYLLAPAVVAQTQPDAGSLMRQAEPEKSIENNVIPEVPDVIQAPEEVEGTRLPVENFEFKGNTILTSEELKQVASSWTGKKLTLLELKHVTDLIAQRYREKGYLVRVFLPEQNIHDGSVLIEIIEARFGDVILDGDTKRLINNPGIFEGMLTYRQKTGELFNLSDIERASLLINDLPGLRANVVLAASDKEKHSDVKLSVSEKKQQTSYVSYDNYGSRSSGESRLIYSTMLANPLKRGDKLAASAMVSEGNLYAKVGYDLPVGFDGIRLGANLSFLRYSLVGDFEDLDAEGSASNLGFTGSYPLIRQVRQNLRLSGGLFIKNYENEQLGSQTSDKAVTAINVGVSGDRLDGFQGGGVFYYGASLTLGDLDLSGNKINLANDKASLRTNGGYNKVDWNVARLQKINEETNLWLSASGQFASKNLDSSETMSLGGANGVRAYPALEASGDEGIIVTTEVRYRFRPNWTLKGFIDAGQITQKSTALEPSEKHTLKGFGVGVDWNNAKHMITARLNIATRIGKNPLRDPVTGDDTDGSSKDYPVWLNITKHF